MGGPGQYNMAAQSAPEGYEWLMEKSRMTKEGVESIPVPTVDLQHLNQQSACWWTPASDGNPQQYHINTGVDRTGYNWELREIYIRTGHITKI
jgi:hypothetical protein